ncbi:hypothetical protein Hanom_Chr10g00957581 [Helianthus anomalus]
MDRICLTRTRPETSRLYPTFTPLILMSILCYLLAFLLALDLSFLSLTGNSYLAKLATFLLDSNFLAFKSSCMLTFYSNHKGSVLLLLSEPLRLDSFFGLSIFFYLSDRRSFFLLSYRCLLYLSFFLTTPSFFLTMRRLALSSFFFLLYRGAFSFFL